MGKAVELEGPVGCLRGNGGSPSSGQGSEIQELYFGVIEPREG